MSDLELKNEILEIKAMLSLLIPKNVPLTYIAEQLGKSRQSVREFLINNFEPEKDFWKKDGKIYLSEGTAIKLLQRKSYGR